MNWQIARAVNSFSHKQVMAAVFLVAAALGAYLVSGYVINDDLVGLVMLALPFGLLVVVAPMLRNWRTGAYVFLSWLMFEDIVRKYMGNNMAIFFCKDVLVAVVYLGFISGCDEARRRPSTRHSWCPYCCLSGLALRRCSIPVQAASGSD